MEAVTVLIGSGAHGHDMMSDFSVKYAKRDWTRNFLLVDHHKDFTPRPCDVKFYIGINDPWLRAQVAEELHVFDSAWLHHHALTNESTWGPGTHINYGVTMTRATLGHHVTVSPGVTICGDVTIGDRCLIGAGAVICDRVTIGNDVTIGAGTIVLPESVIEDGSTYVGNPARRIK